MKKITSVIIIVSFIMSTLCYVPPSFAADTVTQKISSENQARELAKNAGGYYSEGKGVPVLAGNEVALPVIKGDNGEVIGYIVAELPNLVSALNAAGYTRVASALAAAEAGTAGGLAVGSGISSGTIALGAAIAAGVIALAVGASGGGGGSSSTSNH